MDLYTNKEVDVVLAGVLATEEDLQGDRRAIVNSKDYIQCRIKVISDLPSYIPQDEFFTLYSSQLAGFIDDTTMDDNYRINVFVQYLQNKVILFKPYIQKELNKKLIYKVSNSKSEFPVLVNMPEKIGNDNQLVAIPYVEDYHDYELEKRILEGRAIGKLSYFDEMDSAPQFIFNGGCIYGEFTNYKKTSGGWILESIEKPRKIKFTPENYTGYLINYNSKISFISEDLIINIIPQLLKEKGNLITGAFEYHEDENIGNKVLKNNKDNINDNFEINKIVKEEDFLELLNKNIKKANLIYDKRDIISFHTSIKTGSLVILNGMSGTGKSKLVDIYAQTLGISNTTTGQYKMIPVKPNWNDDTDLIGFLDTVNNIYRPAESGLVDILIDAQNSDKLYLVCFDEMNLARVEHYFSQFLSVLEMDTSSRKLTLYNPKLRERVFNSSQYPPEIEIGDNIIFVGTINTDESTHQFSDKVLDRSNLITFNILPFSDWKNKAFELVKIEKPKFNIISYSDFNEWRNREKQPIISDRELEFLQKLNNKLQSIDVMKGIGYRIIVQIDKYLKNLPNNSVMNRKSAFDYQIAQRVLPKLSGTEEQLKELLGNKNKKGTLFELVDEFNDVSDFEKTRSSFERKLKELNYNGYTL